MLNVRSSAVALTLLAVTSGGEAAVPGPHSLLREIEAQGPHLVLGRLWSDRATFEAVCGQIETGDPRWLEVARRLKVASDAASSLSLNYAVARAIPRAPERVLALIGNGFEIRDVCTSPFIEPERGIAENYQRRAIAALARVADSRYVSAKSACLAEIGLPIRK